MTYDAMKYPDNTRFLLSQKITYVDERGEGEDKEYLHSCPITNSLFPIPYSPLVIEHL